MINRETILNQTGKRKARILVVDDDPGLLRLLTIRLRAESYDVEAVESAAQALAASSRFRPDLVITDLRMDQMDGIGLLKELQVVAQERGGRLGRHHRGRRRRRVITRQHAGGTGGQSHNGRHAQRGTQQGPGPAALRLHGPGPWFRCGRRWRGSAW